MKLAPLLIFRAFSSTLSSPTKAKTLITFSLSISKTSGLVPWRSRMFYSHTLLARKTPLGTVWCAAHLQHRLNKKDYQNTKIPLVVDAIMFGEVPLALRTSSYLLLGVVRIYSKQIDYLKHDVDVLVLELRKMYSHASSKLTLPENAYQAPFHSITLPETFDLDALELHSDVYDDGDPDTHTSSQEEITLAGLNDQISMGRDAYVAITFDEDVMMDLSHPGEPPDLGLRSMEEDAILPPHVDTTMIVEDSIGDEDVLSMRLDEDIMPQSFPGVEVPEAVNVQEFDPSHESVRNDDKSPQNVPEVEILREAAPDFSPRDIPMVPPLVGDDTSEPCRLIDENLNQENLLQVMEDNITLPRTSLPFEQSTRPSTSVTSQDAFDMNDTHISFRQSPMEFILQPTPPQQPKPRSRKRKQFFDQSTILTNKFLKKALEDSSDLLCKRRKLPCSSLEVWKLNNSLRKEEVFSHPFITGLCQDLDNIFKVDYIITKCRTILVEEASEDLGDDARNVASTSDTSLCQGGAPSPAPEVASPLHTEIPPTDDPSRNIGSAGETFLPLVVAPSPTREDASLPHLRIPPFVDPSSSSFSEMEIEHLRNVEENRGDDSLADLIASPPRSMPSPRPSEGLDSPTSVIASSGMMSTPGPVLTETSRSMFETPWTIDEGLGTKNNTLSNTPERTNIADENLYFLEAESSPASRSSSRGTQGVDLFSVRTRAVARYLRSLSPIKSISDDSTQDFSLDNILEGKRRKLCARMFYEMLVLKSCDLVDVQQDVPYGDITLKLTSKLTEAQI